LLRKCWIEAGGSFPLPKGVCEGFGKRIVLGFLAASTYGDKIRFPRLKSERNESPIALSPIAKKLSRSIAQECRQ
jgi:hypothetical protein